VISIADMMHPECIKLELKQKKKKKVIREMVEVLAAAKIIEDTDVLVKKLLERENNASTGIGYGIALPHAFTDHVKETVIAFGRSSSGIAFDAIDNRPVHLIFLIVGPASSTGEHLKLLSKLSRLLNDKPFREKLLEVENTEEILNMFREEEEEE